MEIITAGDGTAHVSSADDGTIYAGIAGNECYVTGVGDRLSCTMQGANTALVGTGVGIMYGRAFRVAMPEEVTIQSGTQSQRRHDVICAHFTTSSEGHESGELVVLKGTPTSGQEAEDPEIPSGDILEGATEAYMPLWRIPLDGINVGEPEAMFDVLMSMSELQGEIAEVRDSVSHVRELAMGVLDYQGRDHELSFGWDTSLHGSSLSIYIDGQLVAFIPSGFSGQHSVSQQPRIIVGYKEIKLQTVTDTALLLTAAEVEGIVGRPYDNQRDAVMVMNAYGNITATGASPLHFWQAEWWSDGVRIYLSRDFGASTIRCAYVLFIGEQLSVSQVQADLPSGAERIPVSGVAASYGSSTVQCDAWRLSGLGIAIVQVPVSKAGRSLSFPSQSNGIWISETVNLSLPSGLSAGNDGICFGGVRNGHAWPLAFTFNGRSFSFEVATTARDQQPYQITIAFGC